MALWLLPVIAGGSVAVAYLGKRWNDLIDEEDAAAAEAEAEKEAQQRAEDQAFQRLLQLERTELQERLRSKANAEAKTLEHQRRAEDDARRDQVREVVKEQDRLRNEAFLVSLWQPHVGVARIYTLKGFPGTVTLELESVSVQGLKFKYVTNLVPFGLVEKCDALPDPDPDVDFDLDDDEEDEP
jgi:hypothetical protein